jgi:hypothetical protein
MILVSSLKQRGRLAEVNLLFEGWRHAVRRTLYELKNYQAPYFDVLELNADSVIGGNKS